ncbi:MAG: hypothetical protein MUC87_09385 [Bacteroidia bacterium]|nr:hypothetical protein [Bacteroidia bacterium]
MKVFLHRTFTDKGLLLVLAAGLLLTFYFFGTLVTHPASRYFGYQGDGMQIYYQTAYHVKHDSLWWHQQSMNYPDGENIFFTGALPVYTNLVKVFGPGAAQASIGLLNLLMLFSPLFGAVFLYALFRHWRLPWWYGALCGLGIMFLSPQLQRMSGHYSLALSFMIPALIYGLARFYDYPRIRLSLFIGLLVFFAGGTHLYMLVFCLAAAGMYWFILFITRDRGFGRWKFLLLHFSLQTVLPVLLIQLLIFFTGQAADRTAIPWGFSVFTSNSSGIFYPYGRSYEFIAAKFMEPEFGPGSYEGVSYVGLAAILGLAAVIVVQLIRMVRLRFDLLLSLSDKKVLNIFFWMSLLLLFLSFGWPFLLKEDGSWLKYAGPLRQFRALGRFAWMFFYVVNILAVYRLWKLAELRTGMVGKILRGAVLTVVPVMLFFDGWETSKNLQDGLNNKFEALNDTGNNLPENRWLRKFKASDYQAILPLPYFHNGSEGPSEMPANHEIINITYLVSLKTGLPMLSMLSGRSSISKGHEHIDLVLDPVKPLSLLKRLPDRRPFLVLARKQELTANELDLLNLSEQLFETPSYTVHRLDPAKIEERINGQYQKHLTEYQSKKTWAVWPFMSTDSVRNYSCRDFEEQGMTGEPFLGKKSLGGKAGDFTVLYDATIPGAVPGTYQLSFWFGNFTKDLYPRSVLEIALYTGDKVDTALYAGMYEVNKAVSGHWGLAERTIPVKHSEQRVKVTIWNFDLPKDAPMYADELMIRPENTSLYDVQEDFIRCNNRTYYRKP